MNEIKVENLAKTYRVPVLDEDKPSFFHRQYKDIEAVKDVSFEVEKGEIISILGANGAGKSTIIKMLSGILTPTSGKIIINGFEPCKRQNDFKKLIGVMMGNRSSLVYDLPIIDSLKYLKTIYNVDENDEYNQMIKELMDKISITSLLNTPVRKLSLGQKRKAELIATIIHKPQVLFLDEPTLGLDVNSKKEMNELIKTLADKYQTTVIYTSHELNDVEKLCKRMIYIVNGRITFDGKVIDFGVLKDQRTVKFTTGDDVVLEKLRESFEISKQSETEYSISINKDQVQNVLQQLNAFNLEEIIISKPSLEDEVLNYDQAHKSSV